MSWNSLRDIQNKNMYRMVNHFLYEYRCDMELNVYVKESVFYERDSENKRKRKVVSKKYDRTEYLIVRGNGSENICIVLQNNNKEFEVYVKCYPWTKGAKPTYICENSEEAEKKIEEICRSHYFKKYGCDDTPYSFREKPRKRLSVQEICDWYNQFRKLGMSISEIESELQRGREDKKEKEEYEKILLGVAKKKGIV